MPTLKEKLIQEAHAAVREQLTDPDSASFKDDMAFAAPGAGIVCGGVVNSRNGFGGYTGYQKYWFSRRHGAALEEAGSTAWQELSDACIEAMKPETVRLERDSEPTPLESLSCRRLMSGMGRKQTLAS